MGAMNGATIVVRPMVAGDAPAVLSIYQAGIDTGQASLETTAGDWAGFDAARRAEHRFVAVEPDGNPPAGPGSPSPGSPSPHSGQVVGWIAVSSVSARQVYAGVVEHSVYVAPEARGRGVGRLLLDTLIASTEAAGVWTIQSGVFPENAASLALHQRAGFRVVGVRELVGCRHGVWRDVVLLERRSPTVCRPHPTAPIPTAVSAVRISARYDARQR
jgi:L-amino acid N-acyltransferase YncA